jgi:hypothetical protein
MKKIFLLFVLLFLTRCSSSSHSDFYKTYSPTDYIYWDEKTPLTWSDFQGNPIKSANYASEIHVYIPSTIEKNSVFQSSQFDCVCVFDKKHSWVNLELADTSLLEYNQVIFNIYELYARKLRQSFAEADFGLSDVTEEFHSITEKNNKERTDTIDKFRRESSLGQDKQVIKEWKLEVQNDLEQMKKYSIKYQ